jgi:hypothetical protein
MAEYDAIIFNNSVLYASRNPHQRNCLIVLQVPLSLSRNAANAKGYVSPAGFGIVGERIKPTPPVPGAKVPRESPLEYDWTKS